MYQPPLEHVGSSLHESVMANLAARGIYEPSREQYLGEADVVQARAQAPARAQEPTREERDKREASVVIAAEHRVAKRLGVGNYTATDVVNEAAVIASENATKGIR